MPKEKKGDKTVYVLVTVLIIAVIIIIYLLSREKARQPPTIPDGLNGDSLPDDEKPEAHFHKSVSYQKSITWELDQETEITMISGRYRVGGLPLVYTGVRMYIKEHGSWSRVVMKGSEGGYPGEFIPFAVTVNAEITAIKWEAEQGISGGWGWPFSDRYIDEVYADIFYIPTG